ncbi:MAG: polyprenyl synthetase family protein [Geminicoccaceae bacterium]|nr:polyprenyl synthetase family protein [Geminicoccaceae bacterium]
MADLARRIEAELDRLLPREDGLEERLHAAMRHATLGGGKRMRAFLVDATTMALGGDRAAALRVGAALEMMHAYSLVHDDLPAMDDAALRRGRPSCHTAFDEATAILAGDALQTLAFSALAARDWPASDAVRLDLIAGLAQAAGAYGMCAGQQIDMVAEEAELDLEDVMRLQQLKTGALIGFACEAGAVIAGAGDEVRTDLLAYAADLGLAFQIRDDLLDLTGDVALLGKNVGRDAERAKATFPALLGVEAAERELARLQERACAQLEGLGPVADPLRQLVAFVALRRH